MNTVLALYWTAFALWVAFGTSAVYEYLRLLPFCEWLTHTGEYTEFRKHDLSIGYSEFMLFKYPSFFVRMSSCPYCIGVWFAFAGCWAFDCFSRLPAVYGGACILYLVFTWAVGRLKNG